MGMGMQVNQEGRTVMLRESSYVFRSITTTHPLPAGEHYWEIHISDTTENELKIGITANKAFNMDSAFCDYSFGFGFYTVGGTRSGSNAGGGPYGEAVQSADTIGVYFNTTTGRLMFQKKGKSWGEAFPPEKVLSAIKGQPVYVSVALLHKAGCTLNSNMAIPACFKK